MHLFGYVCSPLCRARADSHGIAVPVFAGQKSVAEARLWRKVGWIGGSVGAVAAALLGFWFWYAWFGSAPRSMFSVRFENPARSGQSILCGDDQIVFLHGGTLARHDMKQKKQIWSHYLIDKKKIEEEVQQELKSMQKLIDKANSDGWEDVPKMPDPQKLARSLERSAAASLTLRVNGQNIWVGSPDKLVRHDWNNGTPAKEIALGNQVGEIIPRGDEILLLAGDINKQVITHINLNTCDTRTEEIVSPPQVAKASNKTPPAKSGRKTGSNQTAGLPVGMPGKDRGKPLDPGKVAEQAQHLSLPEKIALPATLANSVNQERAMNEMSDPRQGSSDDVEFDDSDHLNLIPTADGFIQFGSRLIEQKLVHRTAMKAAPAKSALDGNVTVTKTLEVANEILNEMQRSRGGDTVTEDHSRYQAMVRRPDGKGSWSGEVIGRPSFFPLKTVNVVAGNKSLIVLDKTNTKLWEATLNYKVEGGLDAWKRGPEITDRVRVSSAITCSMCSMKVFCPLSILRPATRIGVCLRSVSREFSSMTKG